MHVSKALFVLLLVMFMACMITACSTDATDEASDAQETQDAQDEVTLDDEEPVVDDGDEPAPFTLTSSAYENGDDIPLAYARGKIGGGDLSPPLTWTGIPDGTRSFAIVMVDRHPIANEWIHWMVVDVPASAEGLTEGASGRTMPTGTRELDNTWGDPGYGGPQPPAGTGEHEYEITVYALRADMLDVAQDASFTDFLTEVRDQMLGAATIIGVFSG